MDVPMVDRLKTKMTSTVIVYQKHLSKSGENPNISRGNRQFGKKSERDCLPRSHLSSVLDENDGTKPDHFRKTDAESVQERWAYHLIDETFQDERLKDKLKRALSYFRKTDR